MGAMNQLVVGQRIGSWTLVAAPVTKSGALKDIGQVHVWRAVDDQGRHGVLKWCPNQTGLHKKPSYMRKRFVMEHELMTKLDGEPGVLPLLDADYSGDSEWFVTQEVTLLEKHLGADPSLWMVVAATAQLAHTLATLWRTLEVTHRDIKPDNLFWINGQALVGDFGIAKGPTLDLIKLTGEGRKLGSWIPLARSAKRGWTEDLLATRGRLRAREDRLKVGRR